jgi:hypothetical protein
MRRRALQMALAEFEAGASHKLGDDERVAGRLANAAPAAGAIFCLGRGAAALRERRGISTLAAPPPVPSRQIIFAG